MELQSELEDCFGQCRVRRLDFDEVWQQVSLENREEAELGFWGRFEGAGHF